MSLPSKLRMQALRGDFYVISDGGYNNGSGCPFAAPRPCIYVFGSSTFTDTHEERNILLSRVLLALREHGRPKGLEVIILDLRSGIPDENTLDHKTWPGCERELLRCFNGSAGLFFLSLQGDKYGYMPIPGTIDQVAFEQRLSERSSLEHSEAVALANEWYQLDTNAVPPVYVLKNLVDDWSKGDASQDKRFWNVVLPSLRDLLQGVVFDSTFEDGIIGRSVTEYEAKLALNLCKNDQGELDQSKLNQGIRWLRREFVGGVTEAQDPKKDLNDARDSATKMKLDNLKAGMESALSQHGLMKVLKVPVDSFNAKDDVHKKYLEEFEAAAKQMLLESMDKVSERML
jgi:hypothetical protein